MSADNDTVLRLRSTLTESLPYCSGTLDVHSRDLVLYYGKGTQTRRIDLSVATTDELDALEKACEPAPFGRNDQTIFDDSYRKAGKMEIDEFMLGFDAERAGLIEVIRSSLFHGAEEEKFVRAELYKLNVYGKDAFFKPHTDTPRAENMFGSLVVVLPTPHEGGALILRHDQREWTFDSGALLSEPGATSRIAFASFFSDVEHEVTSVKTGYRLTITYNLYFSPTRIGYFGAPSSGLRVLQPTSANTPAVSDVLAALLADNSILSEGGALGFGLQHQYPLPKSWIDGDSNPLEALQGWLKGGDAALFSACKDLGLKPQLYLVYENDNYEPILPILLKQAIEVSEYDMENDSVTDVILRQWGGLVMLYHSLFSDSVPEKVCDDGKRRKYLQRLEDTYGYGYRVKETAGLPSKTVHMVTEMTTFNELKSTMVVDMGNEAGLCHMYKYVCLIVDVGPAGKRSEMRPEN
ncbi:hypothetical protein GSI_15464 [Ganoderma sinense ZZ0214-1]|uniref:Fe2OG dioxygenase domain-containing protein n=1 Tax=Ganoderma sinense ZZ0214-1 TaxID=1077348 RepID=A0A2G8RMN8_9APHY|nr:hypothetical protein GSI_15464 [Ganoderma sinense ZZ0214-1]